MKEVENAQASERGGNMVTVLDLCSGGGGEALGLEQAGFSTIGAVDNDKTACATLRMNRPALCVIESDLQAVSGRDFRGVDIIAGGVPCPPFSIAGKRRGPDDERDLFPEALRIIAEARPAAVMLENVPGLSTSKFLDYRTTLLKRLVVLGYIAEWRIMNASACGLPQLRPRFILVAVRERYMRRFDWPSPSIVAPTVGEAIGDLMAAHNWPGAEVWQAQANKIAPTLVGGSKKHGGPDLGPVRAKKQWETLGVDGWGLANEAPGADCPISHRPRLTLRMVARLQGFPDEWMFSGGKTAAYRQIGNALPPPVARQVGASILRALRGKRIRRDTFVASAPYVQKALPLLHPASISGI